MNDPKIRETDDEEEDEEGEEEVFTYLLTYDDGSQRRAFSNETVDEVFQRWNSHVGTRSPRLMRFPPKVDVQLTKFMPRKVQILPNGQPWIDKDGMPLSEDGLPCLDEKKQTIEVETLLPVRVVRADRLLDIELVAGEEVSDEDDEDEDEEDETPPAPEPSPNGEAKSYQKTLPAGFLS